MTNRYPPNLPMAAWRPLRAALVRAGADGDDFDQSLGFCLWRGGDPAREVPRELGFRKVGGAWRSLDPVSLATDLDLERHDLAAAAAGDDRQDSGGILDAAAGGTEVIARHCRISRRAAQLRLLAQIKRFEACADLFVDGVV